MGRDLTEFRLGWLSSRTGTLPSLCDLLASWCARRSGRSRMLGYLNPHVFNQAERNPRVREFLRRCDAVCLDGIGVSAMASLLSGRMLPRVVMDQLVPEALTMRGLSGSALVIGLREEENRIARAALGCIGTGLRVTGGMDGYRDDATYVRLFRENPDVDFVMAGMGTPRSEEILLLAAENCPGAICWSVGGGTLRILAGAKRRGPKFLSRLGLEWTHRFLFEPETRKRYLPGIPLYFANLSRHLLAGALRRNRA